MVEAKKEKPEKKIRYLRRKQTTLDLVFRLLSDYDSIDRNVLHQMLHCFKKPLKSIGLIKLKMNFIVVTVCIQNELPDTFKITKGLKQEGGLVPTLYVALEFAIRQLDIGRGNLLMNKSVQLAAYAD